MKKFRIIAIAGGALISLLLLCGVVGAIFGSSTSPKYDQATTPPAVAEAPAPAPELTESSFQLEPGMKFELCKEGERPNMCVAPAFNSPRLYVWVNDRIVSPGMKPCLGQDLTDPAVKCLVVRKEDDGRFTYEYAEGGR